MKSVIFAGMAAALLAGSSAAAKDKPLPKSPLIDAISQCRAIGDAGQRLACFDKASGDLLQATEKGDISVVDRGQLREARRSLFGFNMPRLPFFSGDRSADDVSDTISSKVTSVRSAGYNRYHVRIEQGGALWETLEAYTSFNPPSPGETVEIKRGPLGSYMLRFGRQRGVKGKRIG